LELKVADSTKPASNVMQQSVTTSASPLRVAIAAADASAVARPTSIASVATGPAPVAPAAPELTADGRIVTSKRTTITYEPLHAVPIPASGLRVAPPSIADSIVVYKRERTLTLFYRGVPQRSYFVALGSKPVGDKLQAGDKRTPEGLFHIDAHNPASKYHLALHISYPDAEHRARSQSLGFDPGGEIMIHGLPKEYSDVGKDHRLDDWTNGCVALTNQEIEEIWRAVPDGTPVQIKP
jgi:lipoprotein-anchoring transpeptidase ErfK/SrfK